jgi:hypothetical protein
LFAQRGDCELQRARKDRNRCAAGSGNDVIHLPKCGPARRVVGSLPDIGPGTLKIVNEVSGCHELASEAYLHVRAGANLTLQGVSMRPDLLFPR